MCDCARMHRGRRSEVDRAFFVSLRIKGICAVSAATLDGACVGKKLGSDYVVEGVAAVRYAVRAKNLHFQHCTHATYTCAHAHTHTHARSARTHTVAHAHTPQRTRTCYHTRSLAIHFV